MTKKSFIILLICLLSLFQTSSAFFIKLNKDNRLFCMQVNEEIIGGKSFNFKYNYSGKDVKNIKCKMVEITTESKRKIVYTQLPDKSETNFTFSHKIEEHTQYEICFESFDKKEKIVSFQYDTFYNKGYTDQNDMKVSKEYLEELQKSIFQLYGDVNEVRANEWSHAAVLLDNKAMIKWGNTMKIGLLIMFGAINLNLLVNMLSKTQTKISDLI